MAGSYRRWLGFTLMRSHLPHSFFFCDLGWKIKEKIYIERDVTQRKILVGAVAEIAGCSLRIKAGRFNRCSYNP